MGTGALNTAVDGTPIPAADNNALVAALKGDLVPRNNSAVAEANAGNIGTETYPFDRANITTGYFVCGMMIPFHDFNGAITPGQGWMKCNGNQVTEAAYDAIHGAGSWDSFIVSSPIENKFLPNMSGKYPVGVTNTTQTGGSAITPVGNTNHQVNLAHTHTAPAHIHEFYRYAAPGQGYFFDASANLTAGNTSGLTGITPNVVSGGHQGSFYTGAGGNVATDSSLSGTQSIQPDSIEVEFWIRII